MAELVSGCQALGIEHAFLFLGGVTSGAELEARLLAAVDKLRPDFLLTINHSGLDREGLVSGMCRHLRLPLLSWFVDRPELFLPEYSNLDNPWLAYAVWDADTVDGLWQTAQGRVFHLPLGTDLARIHFLPPAACPRDVAFVGNSMQAAVTRCWDATGIHAEERALWDEAAEGFADSTLRNLDDFLCRELPVAWEHRRALDEAAGRPLDAFLYWRSTQLYRVRCVRELLPFSPVVAGDGHWAPLLGPGSWTHAGPLNYYADLPGFYRGTKINFNTTSMQMKGALNQRVFDVPASGGFLLTDRRDQLEDAFEASKEVVCYDSPEEIGDLARHYLARPAAREKIAARARRRIEREHSYVHRLGTICASMRDMFGTPA
jgi:spore maturation protein CgeB